MVQYQNWFEASFKLIPKIVYVPLKGEVCIPKIVDPKNTMQLPDQPITYHQQYDQDGNVLQNRTNFGNNLNGN